MFKVLAIGEVCELTLNGDGFSVCSAFMVNAELLEHKVFHSSSRGRQIVS